MKSKVKEAKDLRWSFGDRDPALYLPVTSWGERVKVDPWPCYAHDKELVEDTLKVVVDRSWDLDVPIFIGYYEGLERSNAWAGERWCYNKEENVSYIFLLGKRIPPHPAVTRYLVAHEYGHCVEFWLNRKLGFDNEGRNPHGLREEYRKLRGIKNVKHYGGGTWHKSPGEIFACDFRILVCGVEKNYWPHQGIEKPTRDSPVGRWWSHLTTWPEDEWKPPKEFND